MPCECFICSDATHSRLWSSHISSPFWLQVVTRSCVFKALRYARLCSADMRKLGKSAVPHTPRTYTTQWEWATTFTGRLGGEWKLTEVLVTRRGCRLFITEKWARTSPPKLSWDEYCAKTFKEDKKAKVKEDKKAKKDSSSLRSLRNSNNNKQLNRRSGRR